LKEVKRQKKKADELSYINPELSEKHRGDGNELYKAGDYAKAVEQYEEAVKRNPKDKRAYNNLAASFSKMLKFSEAMKFADKALELDPDFVKAISRKATIYQFTKEYHKAIENYEKILKLDPENKDAKEGIRVTQGKIAMGMQGDNDEERVKKAMNDPEIQQIMSDPMMRIALERMQSNPQQAMEYFNDPTLGPKLQKLIQAGIIKTG
jgi:stress-induced-phosphoprotein 1